MPAAPKTKNPRATSKHNQPRSTYNRGMTADRLIILGASARAAAFSAMRAGFEPWCADLFADADLESRCMAHRVPAALYPHGLEEAITQAPPGPCMYTGGLEHDPELIERISRLRPLWGNPASVLREARCPEYVHNVLTRTGLRSPRLGNDGCDPRVGWLVKPRRGHAAIRPWAGEAIDDQHYLQEKIEGESIAAVFLAGHESVELCGVTQQLVGEAWLHAPPYRYCGSIGPLEVAANVQESLIRLGEVLRTDLGLRGLFGVDCILRDQAVWPLEVNPRYTASVEILEYAAGRALLADHAAIFRSGPEPGPTRSGTTIAPQESQLLGKAILYARENLTVPATGPWTSYRHQDINRMPPFADIPHPAERIEQGEPVLTFFDRGADCLTRLKKLAVQLDCALTKDATARIMTR
jgi:predicted ATP-grasp superfamily ATP-dependent carboligase